MDRPINLALVKINTRAERSTAAIVEDLYLDRGSLLTKVASHDHQVLFGRRGSGKTATLMALRRYARERGDVPALLDLRQMGSAGIYFDDDMALRGRGARLLGDILRHLCDELLDLTLSNREGGWTGGVLDAVEQLAAAATDVQVLEAEPGTDAEAGPSRPDTAQQWTLSTGGLTGRLEELTRALPGRLWLLLDEWSRFLWNSSRCCQTSFAKWCCPCRAC